MKWTRLLVVFVSVAGLLGTGCSSDEPSGGNDDSCVLNSDCADGEICASDGTCVPVDDACSLDEDCTDIPEPSCSGDDLITYGGVCDGQDVKVCNYPAVDSETCATGCSNGQCNPDPCGDVACDSPPAPSCEDADTLVTYSDSGTCTDGDCSYSPTSETCVHGCSNGACNPGPCEQNACDTPPAPDCDGNTGLVYADTGTCSVDNGSASCSYDLTYNNCDYVGGTCDASTGTCTGAVAEVGGAVITEMMVNPDGIWDGDGEWFEVVNTSGAEIDLTGWKIQSGSAGGTDEEHALTSPPTFADGATLIFASSDDPAGDGSVTPDYVYSDINLMNTSDWLQLVNASDEVVDFVYWEAGAAIAGKSRKLDPSASMSAEANNDFANWCPELDTEYGAAGNWGTPGADNPACAADPCAGVTCEKPDDYCKDPGTAVEFTNDTATCQESRFHNPYCDFAPADVDCTDAQYCLSGVCEDVTGQLPAPGDVVFTEFMGNPDAIGDTDGEYLELYNTTDQELTLFTLVIHDDETGAASDSFTVENPNATIPAKGYAVFVTNTDSTLNGGISGGYLLADSPLKNSPGTSGLVITLELRDGTVIDDAYYGEPTAGVSQQLGLDAYTGSATNIDQANDAADNFCPATVADTAYTSGDLGSPGAENEACL